MFESSKAMDLGLLAIDAAPSPEGHDGEGPLAPVMSSVSMPASSGNGSQKFQLGVTLPVVPAGIVQCILHGDYVDMVELSKENLELELMSADQEKGKPTPAHKLHPVLDLIL